MGFVCPTCGETHTGLPDIGFRYPDYFFAVPEQERDARIDCSSDLCRVDDDYFVRGVILLPVRDHDDDFGIGVWVSQKKEHFELYAANPDSAATGPFFGWLSNHLPFYEDETLLLKTRVHYRDGGQRPRVELAPCGHPLYRDQAQGITMGAAWEMVHWYDRRHA